MLDKIIDKGQIGTFYGSPIIAISKIERYDFVRIFTEQDSGSLTSEDMLELMQNLRRLDDSRPDRYLVVPKSRMFGLQNLGVYDFSGIEA